MSLLQLGRRLRRGETTSVALTKAALKSLGTTGRQLRCVVTATRERALREAAQADAELGSGIDRGPLHGIPYGAKDLFAAAGYPTTWGAGPFKRQRFAEDADVIKTLRGAGAVLTAKLSMIELAGGIGYNQPDATFTGPTRSPTGQGAWAGGSSSGSAAAVAAGCLPFSLGTETLGSIVQPAAFSGTTGFRPTYGNISRRGAMALTWTMDKVGFFAPTAADCAILARVLCSRSRVSGAARTSRPKFAVLRSRCESSVRANFDASIDACQTIGDTTEVTLPNADWAEIASIVVRAETIATFGQFIVDGRAQKLAAPEARLNGLEAFSISAETYINAQRVRERLARQLHSFLEPFDALVAPTIPFVATDIDEAFTAYYDLDYDISLVMAGNLAGLPAVAIPNGVGSKGRATSLCLVGRAHSDTQLLRIASRLQRAIGRMGPGSSK